MLSRFLGKAAVLCTNTRKVPRKRLEDRFVLYYFSMSPLYKVSEMIHLFSFVQTWGFLHQQI